MSFSGSLKIFTTPYLQNTPPKNPPTSASPMVIYAETDTVELDSLL